MAEDHELFDTVNKGKSEAYTELYEKAVQLATSGNERFLVYLLEKIETELLSAQEIGSKDVGDDKNVTQNIDKKRILEAIAKDKFLTIEGSEDANETNGGNTEDKS